MPAITAVFYVCYIKAAMNNICGICWLVLLFFFPSVHPSRMSSSRWEVFCWQGAFAPQAAIAAQALCCKTPLCLHGAWGSFTAGAVPLQGEPVGGMGLEVCLPHH